MRWKRFYKVTKWTKHINLRHKFGSLWMSSILTTAFWLINQKSNQQKKSVKTKNKTITTAGQLSLLFMYIIWIATVYTQQSTNQLILRVIKWIELNRVFLLESRVLYIFFVLWNFIYHKREINICCLFDSRWSSPKFT